MIVCAERGEMQDLNEIGFYTLSNKRAINASIDSPLWRAELILTDKCNFSCPYCRGVKDEYKGDMPFADAVSTLELWFNEGLKNVRFSGGEPTLYDELFDLVGLCNDNDVDRIAISTNGSASLDYYKELIYWGVNDFSISLDSGCCSTGEKMTGNISDSWDKAVNSIRELSKLTCVTIGMVFDENNIENCYESLLFAISLNPSDIRIIPSAQYNKALTKLSKIPANLTKNYPILKYRIENLSNNLDIRGLTETDSDKCPLVLDDVAVIRNHHYPCIIYLREGGNPIGTMNNDFRKERLNWYQGKNVKKDTICKKNCLDVCRDYNNYKGNHETIWPVFRR
jgi:cyclic pyranopterin phosphate synthase